MLQSFYNLRYWLSWIVLAGVAAAIVYWGFVYETDPRTVRLAVDAEESWHTEFGAALKRNVERQTDYRVQVLRTGGPDESRGRVLDGNADLALVQLGSVTMRNLAGVAPLWDEYMHLLVREGSGIASVRDLAGRNVAVGPEGSASRASARRLLDYHDVELSALESVDTRTRDILDQDEVEAAIVTRGLMDPDLRSVIASGEFELLPIAGNAGFAFNHRHFRAASIPAGVYPTAGAPMPVDSLATLSVDAILAGRPDLHEGMVETVLGVLRSGDMQSQFPDLVDRDPLSDRVWQALPVHEATVAHYARDAHTGRADGVVAAAIDNAVWLLALAIVGLIAIYQWWRQRRSQTVTQTLGVKRHLEQLFQDVFRIETAQREARDVRVLQEHLNELNQIKSRAMKLALGTPVGESSLFLAFLQQARSVAEQIEWRLSMAAMPSSQSGNRQPAREGSGAR